MTAQLLDGLTDEQAAAVQSSARVTVVVAGAGTGKTEGMARRVAWWVAVDQVPKEAIVAFTFTERAADEMKFRIRSRLEWTVGPDQEPTLGDMYVGTIHGFCLQMLRDLDPDTYHHVEILDDIGRIALVWHKFDSLLGLNRLKDALGTSKYESVKRFLQGYDLLHEFHQFAVELPSVAPPARIEEEGEWCEAARLLTDVGSDSVAEAFADVAARYYALLKARRFLDFSTSQTELVRLLEQQPEYLDRLRSRFTHVMVDEMQDLNPVQDRLLRLLTGDTGALTAVGDHRQAIYGWRGGRVEIMARWFDDARRTGTVVELTRNFRSTFRIITLANAWAATIDPTPPLTMPAMQAGSPTRQDADPSHVMTRAFSGRRDAEAAWIAETIARLVPDTTRGALHDTSDGGERGLTYADIAVLVRTSRDVLTYMTALEQRGIPAVVQAGPDLFRQPEVLLFLGLLYRLAGLEAFFGSNVASTIQDALACAPTVEAVVEAAADTLRRVGLPVPATEHLLAVTALWHGHMSGQPIATVQSSRIRTPEFRAAFDRPAPRRIFPQTLYHWILAETEVNVWDALAADTGDPRAVRAETALFHLGQLSRLVLGLETPGWTDPGDFRSRLVALTLWGFDQARVETAALLVPPNAVTVSTIHAAKGLEFAAVFIADVVPQRFPSRRATTPPRLPFGGTAKAAVDPDRLADDERRNAERRLMYVALTRSERYLFVTTSKSPVPGRSARTPHFFSLVDGLVRQCGGRGYDDGEEYPVVGYCTAAHRPQIDFSTSFSDLQYYLACPHDFYLRKVLGFAPTIDQAFGYGRGVHNLLRAIHTEPAVWAALAEDRARLEAHVGRLVDQGLFYLRYSAGKPAENMRRKAVEVVANYVQAFAHELARLAFEPERRFETLLPLPDGAVLVSGSIDVVRLDDPPRVTVVDFKSGSEVGENDGGLDREAMALQVALYGLAAQRELAYEPERGVIRYLADGNETVVALDAEALARVRTRVADTAQAIRSQRFYEGPRTAQRCGTCDFRTFCGHAVQPTGGSGA